MVGRSQVDLTDEEILDIAAQYRHLGRKLIMADLAREAGCSSETIQDRVDRIRDCASWPYQTVGNNLVAALLGDEPEPEPEPIEDQEAMDREIAARAAEIREGWPAHRLRERERTRPYLKLAYRISRDLEDRS